MRHNLIAVKKRGKLLLLVLDLQPVLTKLHLNRLPYIAFFYLPGYEDMSHVLIPIVFGVDLAVVHLHFFFFFSILALLITSGQLCGSVDVAY